MAKNGRKAEWIDYETAIRQIEDYTNWVGAPSKTENGAGTGAIFVYIVSY